MQPDWMITLAEMYGNGRRAQREDLIIHVSGKSNLTTLRVFLFIFFIPTGVNVGPNLLEKKRFCW